MPSLACPGDHAVDIVRDRELRIDLDVDLVERPAGAIGTSADRVEQHICVLWDERRPQPTVCDLTGEFERLRAQRGEVDRQIRLGRDGRLEGFALAAGAGQYVVLAVVHEAFAAQAEPDDVDVLTQSTERLCEGSAVQSLDDLWAADPESEGEPIAGDLRQGECRQRCGRRCPGRDLHDPGADADVLGDRGEIPERCNGLHPPCLGRPDRVDTEPVSCANVGNDVLPVLAVGVGAADRDRDPHGSTLPASALTSCTGSASPATGCPTGSAKREFATVRTWIRTRVHTVIRDPNSGRTR